MVNPLILRYKYSLLRPKDTVIYSAVYLGLIAVILFFAYVVIWSSSIPQDMNIEEIHRGVYAVLVIMQVAIILIWASYNSGSAIPNEIQRKSYDFFRLLPLTPWQKTTGILIGSNVITYILGAINFILLLVFGSLGQYNFEFQVATILLLISLTLFLNSLTLLASINPDSKRKSGTQHPAKLIVLGLFIAPYLSFFFSSKIVTSKVTFFVFTYPAGYFWPLVIVYCAFWVLLGVLRRFKLERVPLFSFPGAVLFLIGFEGIAAGLFWPFFRVENYIGLYSYRVLSLVALFLISVGILNNESQYLEKSRRILLAQYPTANSLGRFLWRSNLGKSLKSFLIWAFFTMTFLLFADNPVWYNAAVCANLFLYYLFFISLIELNILYRQQYRKVKILLIFIGLTFLFVPLYSMIFIKFENIYLYSLFGFISALFDQHNQAIHNIKVQGTIFLVNSGICLVPLYFIYKGYNNILALAKEVIQSK
ncbi:MAG: hypothetical protein HY920_01305 [Elusimicrobia bacterium]|nr:hypothetical protein [Elusimicrobiota bacterium]